MRWIYDENRWNPFRKSRRNDTSTPAGRVAWQIMFAVCMVIDDRRLLGDGTAGIAAKLSAIAVWGAIPLFDIARGMLGEKVVHKESVVLAAIAGAYFMFSVLIYAM